MEMQEYIPLDIFCRQHGVELTVISSLQSYGLIEIFKVNEVEYVEQNHLAEAEKVVRLYSELNINPEGIDAIVNLLQRIKELDSEIQYLKNRLNLYEENL
jgi:hypothetical protein